MKQENVESLVSVVNHSKDRSEPLSFMALCAAMSGEEFSTVGYTTEECIRAATHLREYQKKTGTVDEAFTAAIEQLEEIGCLRAAIE